jgi:hypothetical protein
MHGPWMHDLSIAEKNCAFYAFRWAWPHKIWDWGWEIARQSRINVLNCKAVETESKPNRCDHEFHLKDLHPNFVMVKTFYSGMVQPYSIGLLDLHILVSSLEWVERYMECHNRLKTCLTIIMLFVLVMTLQFLVRKAYTMKSHSLIEADNCLMVSKKAPIVKVRMIQTNVTWMAKIMFLKHTSLDNFTN